MKNFKNESKQTVKFVHASVEYKFILWNKTFRYRDSVEPFNCRILIFVSYKKITKTVV